MTSKLDSYQNRLQYAELKIQVLEERLRLKRIQMYGPGSEKLTNEQLVEPRTILGFSRLKARLLS